MQTLAINYDRKYDTLYVDVPSEEPTYGTGGENGIVTFLGINSDKVLGFMVEEFKTKVSKKQITEKDIPINMNIFDPAVMSLVFNDDGRYRITLCC